jgi:hypothetical protein
MVVAFMAEVEPTSTAVGAEGETMWGAGVEGVEEDATASPAATGEATPEFRFG